MSDFGSFTLYRINSMTCPALNLMMVLVENDRFKAKLLLQRTMKLFKQLRQDRLITIDYEMLNNSLSNIQRFYLF